MNENENRISVPLFIRSNNKWERINIIKLLNNRIKKTNNPLIRDGEVVIRGCVELFNHDAKYHIISIADGDINEDTMLSISAPARSNGTCFYVTLFTDNSGFINARTDASRKARAILHLMTYRYCRRR